MKYTVLTLFPEMFAPVENSILKRAQEAGSIEIELLNYREHALSKHKNVDDVPYGGGAGMVLKPEPIFSAVRSLPQLKSEKKRTIILLTPQGKVLDQNMVRQLAAQDEIVLICGHYEGFDERIRVLADEELSIGDYVMTGGELAAMVVIDTVSRLVPGVLGRTSSAEEDSHQEGLLEYPQYTRPPEFEGMQVPDILLSGHHANIASWRRKESLKRTFLRRPDLISPLQFKPTDYDLLEELAAEYSEIAQFRAKWQHLKPPEKSRRKKAVED